VICIYYNVNATIRKFRQEMQTVVSRSSIVNCNWQAFVMISFGGWANL
jgi:hypothetical protein